jgi:hypothetical protein
MSRHLACILASFLFFLAFHSLPASATPALARREQLACTTCHTAFPELNDFGSRYKERGYRLNGEKNGVKTTGTDLGPGIILDPTSPIAARLQAMLVGISDDGGGNVQVATQPLEDAVLLATGISGNRWSYFAELEASAEGGYIPDADAVLRYRANHALTLYTGWVPLFNEDPFDSINEARRIETASYAIDYTGTINADLTQSFGQIGLFGKAGRLFYMGAITPGPNIITSVGEPLDYMGRFAMGLGGKGEVGCLAYYDITNTDSTLRAGIDTTLWTPSGNFKGVVLYDTLDSAIMAEVGWDLPMAKKSLTFLPYARVDFVNVSDATTTISPTLGYALGYGTGRVAIELTEPIDTSADSLSIPTVGLSADANF